MRRPFVLLSLAVFAGAALIAPSAASATSACSTTNVAICVDVTHAPDSVSATTPLTKSYVASTVTVRNTGTATATHVVVDDHMPAGSTAVAASSTVGSCTIGSGVTCDLGSLPQGASAVISLSFTSPSSAGTATNPVTTTSDDSTVGGHPVHLRAKVDLTDSIPVTVVDGQVQTWLPAGVAGALSTSTTADASTTASRPQVAGAIIPAQPAGETVVLKRNSAPFACPKHAICRGGDWTEAHIANLSGQPLQFELRWDASLVSPEQSVKNFVVYYRKTLDATTQDISTPCDATASIRPCLKDITEYGDGDFSVVVVKDDNGYMR
jgi:uncharacterized repeat protein (TIGR01451 family)